MKAISCLRGFTFLSLEHISWKNDNVPKENWRMEKLLQSKIINASLFPLQVYINWMNFIFNLVFPLTILLTLNIKIYRELRTLRYPYAINGLPMTVDAIEDSPVAAPFIRKPRAPKINCISCLTIDDAEERDRNTRYVLCKGPFFT